MASKSYTLAYNMINRDKYEYYPPVKNENGSYICSCRYRLSKNEVVPVYFETPRLTTPSGIVKIGNDFFLDLEIPNGIAESTFYDYIISNDEYNIHQCHQNSKEWFNNHLPLHAIEKYYKNCLVNKAGGNLPIWRVRIPSYKGKIIPEIYNHQKELLDPSYIESGDEIVCIVEFIGLQFHAKQFSPEYEIQKMKIFKPNRNKSISKGFLFSDEDDDIVANAVQSVIPSSISRPEMGVVKNASSNASITTHSSNILTNLYSSHINNFITRNSMIMTYPVMRIKADAAQSKSVANTSIALAMTQPVVAESKPKVGVQPVVAELPPKVGMQPVVAELPPKVGVQPVVAESKPKVGVQPVAAESKPQVGMQPVVTESIVPSPALKSRPEPLEIGNIDDDLEKMYEEYEDDNSETEITNNMEEADIADELDDDFEEEESESDDMEMDDSDLLELELVH